MRDTAAPQDGTSSIFFSNNYGIMAFVLLSISGPNARQESTIGGCTYISVGCSDRTYATYETKTVCSITIIDGAAATREHSIYYSL